MRKGDVRWSQLRGSWVGFRTRRTYIVEVDVYPAIVRKYKVADGVCPLYGLGVVVEGV